MSHYKHVKGKFLKKYVRAGWNMGMNPATIFRTMLQVLVFFFEDPFPDIPHIQG